MTDLQCAARRRSAWTRHRSWVVALLAAPAVYLAADAGIVALESRARSHGGVQLGVGVLALFALAIIGPIVALIVAGVSGHRVWRAWRRQHGHLTRDEHLALQRRTAFDAGHLHGRQVHQNLLGGQAPPEITVWGLVPAPGERFHLEGVADYARYYGTDVTYSSGGVVAFGRPAWVVGSLIGYAVGTSIARSRAQQLAVSQWREHQRVQVLVSDQRVVCHVAGTAWLSFWFSAVEALYPDLEASSITFQFPDTAPLALSGPMIPAVASLAVRMTHGLSGLQQHPALRSLNQK